MSTKDNFANNIQQLADSTLEFFYKPGFYREVLRSSPRYFVHAIDNGKHVFGLSKFCAFKNITVAEYISTYRYTTRGGVTQKHIAWLTGQNWIERNKVDNEIREAFDNWISEFFPNYALNNASFITIPLIESITKRKKRQISLEQLLRNLSLNEKIGKVGEEIALSFELDRLRTKGIKKPDSYVEQVSIKDAAAGYDIYSSTKDETRYIEVKSSLSNNQEFFISQNEIQTLSTLEEQAFLYFVQVSDLENKLGEVYKIYRNPIKNLRENGLLAPVLYKAKFNID